MYLTACNNYCKYRPRYGRNVEKLPPGISRRINIHKDVNDKEIIEALKVVLPPLSFLFSLASFMWSKFQNLKRSTNVEISLVAFPFL